MAKLLSAFYISFPCSSLYTWLIPLIYFEVLVCYQTFDRVSDFIFEAIISRKGSDAWWYMAVKDLLPAKYRDKASEYEKGTDTMDVWFDSGTAV